LASEKIEAPRSGFQDPNVSGPGAAQHGGEQVVAIVVGHQQP
jgi:hypothetical protein